MTESANVAQHDAWNGDGGRRWVATADRRDEVLGPVADALLAAAIPAEGDRVLDVGCGCGVTTLLAGRAVGATGAATGIDLSEPMLDVARAGADDARNVRFLQADAQTHMFDAAAFDLVISRFGSMFFDDPVRAFANLADAMKTRGPNGAWQPGARSMRTSGSSSPAAALPATRRASRRGHRYWSGHVRAVGSFGRDRNA